jgi:hypothetical protein
MKPTSRRSSSPFGTDGNSEAKTLWTGIVEKVELRSGEGHSGRQRDETGEHSAERIVVEEMKS